MITDTDWSLKISEREMAFRPATDVMAMKSLMWDIAVKPPGRSQRAVHLFDQRIGDRRRSRNSE